MQDTNPNNPYEAPETRAIIMPEMTADDQIMASLGLGDPKDEAVHRGHKTAAIAMIIIALVSFGSLGIIFQFGVSAFALAIPIAGVIDLALGVAILFGYMGVLGFVKFRLFAGLVLYSLWTLSQGDFFGFAFQLLYCGSLLMLVLRNPGLVRYVFGTMGASLCVLLTILGILALLFQ